MSKEGDRASVFRTTKVRTKFKGDNSWMQRDSQVQAETGVDEKPWMAEVRASRLDTAQEPSPAASLTPSTAPVDKPILDKTPGSGYLTRDVFPKTENKPAPTSTSNGFRTSPAVVRPAPPPQTASTPLPTEGQLSLEEQEKRTEAASNVLKKSSVRQRSYVLSAAKKFESTEKEPDTSVNSSPSFVAKRVEITDDDETAAPAATEPQTIPSVSPARPSPTAPLQARLPASAPAPIPAPLPAAPTAPIPAPLPASAPAPLPARLPASTPAPIPAPLPASDPAPIPAPLSASAPAPIRAPLPASTPAPLPASASAPAPIRAPLSASAPAPLPASAPAPIPAPLSALAPAPIPAPLPASAPAPIPAPLSASAPAPIPAPLPASAPAPIRAPLPASAPAPLPARLPASTPAPLPASAPAPLQSTPTAPIRAPLSASAPAPIPAPLPASAPAPIPAPLSASAPAPIPAPLPASAPAPIRAPLSASAPAPIPAPLPASAPASLPARLPASTPAPLPASAPAPLPASAPAPLQSTPTAPIPGPLPASAPAPIPAPLPASTPAPLLPHRSAPLPIRVPAVPEPTPQALAKASVDTVAAVKEVKADKPAAVAPKPVKEATSRVVPAKEDTPLPMLIPKPKEVGMSKIKDAGPVAPLRSVPSPVAQPLVQKESTVCGPLSPNQTSLLDSQIEAVVPKPTRPVLKSLPVDESSLVSISPVTGPVHKESVVQKPVPAISNCIVITDDLLSLTEGPEELVEPVPPSPGLWSQDLLGGPESISGPVGNSLDLLAKDVIPINTEERSLSTDKKKKQEWEQKYTDTQSPKETFTTRPTDIRTENYPASWGSQGTTTTVFTSSSTDPFDPYPIGTTSPNSSSDPMPALSAHSIKSESTHALEALADDVIPIDTDTKSLSSRRSWARTWEIDTSTDERQEDVPASRGEDQQTLVTFERKSLENDSPWDRWTSPTVFTVPSTTEEEEQEEESPGGTETQTVTTVTSLWETYSEPESAMDRFETYSSSVTREDSQRTETPEPKKPFVYVKEYVNATERSLHNAMDDIGSGSEILTSSSASYSYSSPTSYSRTTLSSTCNYCGEPVGNEAKITIEHLNINCHPDCFKCGVCSTPMGDLIYSMFLHGGVVHCESCYSALD